MSFHFNRTSQDELRAEAAITRPAPLADYAAIKASIDLGISKQEEGKLEVAEGLKRMIETKAYLSKYKSIKAFAEHEYGKSKPWVFDQIALLIPKDDTNKAKGRTSDPSANNGTPSQSVAVNTTPPKPNPAPPQPPAPPEPKIVEDATGFPIPKRCLALWEEREEPKKLMSEASDLKCFFQGYLNKSVDGLYAPLSGQVRTFFESMNQIYAYLEHCKPYAVCPGCNGDGEFKNKPCPMCLQRGLVSKNQWERDWTILGITEAHKQSIIQGRCSN